MISDEMMFHLENMFQYKVEEIPMFDFINPKNESDENNQNNQKEIFEEKPIKNYKEYSTLYGMFMENVFNYYYSKKIHNNADFVIKLDKIINNTIVIPKELISGYKLLKIRIPTIKDHIITLSEINRYKNLFRKNEEELYSYLCNELNHNYLKEFFIECYNDVSNYSKEILIECINNLDVDNKNINNKNNNYSNNNIINSIFKITIFYHQMNHETAYLWNTNFTEELNDLQY
jgi:hypothetical protein